MLNLISIERMKETERVDRKSEFSLKQLSRVENLIMSAMFSLDYSPNAHLIYLMIFKHEGYEKFKKDIEKLKPEKKIAFPLFKTWKPEEDWNQVRNLVGQRKFESASKIMRRYGYEIPTYQTIVRTLEGLYMNCWVEKRFTEPFKKGATWILPNEIREKMKKEKPSK